MFETISNLHREAHDYMDASLDTSKGDGGKIRQTRGNLVESIVETMWESFGGQVKTKDYFVHTNDYGSIRKALDCHLYLNGVLVACMECKSYLDLCYLQRADWDSRIIKQVSQVPCSVVALENACASDSLNYVVGNQNIDNIFFLVPGKRSSAKPLYKREYFKEIDATMFDKLYNYMKGLSQ
ncbi:MAG: hypothetical protein ACPHL3_01285 [Paracoccaceae bacterium]|jgi:hypothetical protein